MSPEEASEVLNKWNENCFGEKTQIRKANQPERPLRAVLIRDVPTELSEQDIIDSIEKITRIQLLRDLWKKTELRWVRSK